jgi:hypothetical protein
MHFPTPQLITFRLSRNFSCSKFTFQLTRSSASALAETTFRNSFDAGLRLLYEAQTFSRFAHPRRLRLVGRFDGAEQVNVPPRVPMLLGSI